MLYRLLQKTASHFDEVPFQVYSFKEFYHRWVNERPIFTDLPYKIIPEYTAQK